MNIMVIIVVLMLLTFTFRLIFDQLTTILIIMRLMTFERVYIYHGNKVIPDV